METLTVTLTMPLDIHTREECIEKLQWFADSDHFSGLHIHDEPEPGAIHGVCPTPDELKVDELASAARAVLADLERYAATHGPGPDRRLADLKAAIARLDQGEVLTPPQNPITLAARCALADLEGIMPEFEPSGDRLHSGWKTIEDLRSALGEEVPQ